MTSDALVDEIHAWIVEVCDVADPPAAPDPAAPLIGPDSPYGLDSIDAMEIAVNVQKRYGVRIPSRDASQEAMQSLRTLADRIRRERET